MTPSQYRGFFTIAVIMMLGSLTLPLSSEPAAGMLARPALLAGLIAATALYAAAGLLPMRLSIPAGLAGVVVSGAVSLKLLGDEAIAGNAAIGFWLPVLATWLAAGLCCAWRGSPR